MLSYFLIFQCSVLLTLTGVSEREGEGDLWAEHQKQRLLWHHDVPQESTH